MKDITITIPFMDAIRDIPSWGKFLKDIINHKGKMEEYGLVSLVEESKAMFTRIPPKQIQDLLLFLVELLILHLIKLYVI